MHMLHNLYMLAKVLGIFVLNSNFVHGHVFYEHYKRAPGLKHMSNCGSVQSAARDMIQVIHICGTNVP